MTARRNRRNKGRPSGAEAKGVGPVPKPLFDVPVITQEMADAEIAKIGIDLSRITIGMRKEARRSLQVREILRAVREQQSGRPDP